MGFLRDTSLKQGSRGQRPLASSLFLLILP